MMAMALAIFGIGFALGGAVVALILAGRDVWRSITGKRREPRHFIGGSSLDFGGHRRPAQPLGQWKADYKTLASGPDGKPWTTASVRAWVDGGGKINERGIPVMENVDDRQRRNNAD